jgi:hypothetical protein
MKCIVLLNYVEVSHFLYTLLYSIEEQLHIGLVAPLTWSSNNAQRMILISVCFTLHKQT